MKIKLLNIKKRLRIIAEPQFKCINVYFLRYYFFSELTFLVNFDFKLAALFL